MFDEVEAFFAERLAPTMIPRDPAAHAAPATGSTVIGFAPESDVARAYRQLAKELVAAQLQPTGAAVPATTAAPASTGTKGNKS